MSLKLLGNANGKVYINGSNKVLAHEVGAAPSGTISITQNGTHDVTNYASANVNVQSTEIEPKDINFYDYDGTLVESWTLEELATKTELPTQPDHSSDIEYAGQTIPLTADGWNWTLEKLQEVNHSGINVGSTYKTTDDKLNMCVYIKSDNNTRSITLYPNGTATIDWGDGTVDTVTGTNVGTYKTTSHTYASKGNYIIKIAKVSGTVRISQILDSYAVLEYVYYSNQLEYNTSAFGTNASNANILQYMTIPNTATFVNAGGTPFGQACRALEFLVLPSGAGYGNNGFNTMYRLKGGSLPYKGGYGANGFLMLLQIEELPYMANIISYNNNGMQNLYALKKYTVPSTVTTIGSGFLANAYTIKELKFEPTTPPTISGTSFSNMNAFCKILVPQGTLEAYTTATNYPSPSTYVYEEY